MNGWRIGMEGKVLGRPTLVYSVSSTATATAVTPRTTLRRTYGVN
jgi:hypothetical protein